MGDIRGEERFLPYSVATGGYDDKPLRWIYCFDSEGCAFRARKGDRLGFYGYFEERFCIGEDVGEKRTRWLSPASKNVGSLS